MLIEHEGKRPSVADSAWIAPTAVLSGDVTVGPGSRVMFGAVLTADGGAIEIGAQCIVMENAVVRGRAGYPVRLGQHVLIGPHAHVNGTLIEDDVFVATGAALFPGARVGAGSEVRINAVVHVNTSLPAGTTVPISWVAVGDPAQLFPPDAHDAFWPLQRDLNFPRTVFGIERQQFTMAKATEHYAELFGRHMTDRLVE